MRLLKKQQLITIILLQLLFFGCLSKEDCKSACFEGCKKASEEVCTKKLDRSDNSENLMLNINLDERKFQPFHFDLVNSFAILGKIKEKRISSDTITIKLDFRIKEGKDCNKFIIKKVYKTIIKDATTGIIKNPCPPKNGNLRTHHLTIEIEKVKPNDIVDDYTNFDKSITFLVGDIIDIHIDSTDENIGSVKIPDSCYEVNKPDFGNGICKAIVNNGGN